MGRRLRALALAGALIAASAGLAATTAEAAASAPPLSTGTLQSSGVTMSNLFGKLKITSPSGNCCTDGTVGTSYSQELTATGGGGFYKWSIESGQLPPGLQITSGYHEASPGLISGTPTAAGTFGFVVSVRSLDGQTADLNGKITIN